MSIHWMKLHIVDREIKGRDFAQRRVEVFEVLRANATAMGGASFDDGELPLFFLFKCSNHSPLRKQIREALGEGDSVLIGLLKLEDASFIGQGPVSDDAAREASFDEFWRS